MSEQHPLGSYDMRDYVASCNNSELQDLLPKKFILDPKLIYGEVQEYYLINDRYTQKLSIMVNGPIKFVVDESGLYRELEVIGWDENVWYIKTPAGQDRISNNFQYAKCYGFVYQHSRQICSEKLMEVKLQLFEAEKELLKKQEILEELQKEVQQQLSIVDDKVSQCTMLQSRTQGLNDQMVEITERIRLRNKELAALSNLIDKYESLDVSLVSDLAEKQTSLLYEEDGQKKDNQRKNLNTLEEDISSCQAQLRVQKQQEEKVRDMIQKDTVKLDNLTAEKEKHASDSEKAKNDVKRCKKRANKAVSKFSQAMGDYNRGKMETVEMSNTMKALTSHDSLHINKRWGSTPSIVAHVVNSFRRSPRS